MRKAVRVAGGERTYVFVPSNLFCELKIARRCIIDEGASGTVCENGQEELYLGILTTFSTSSLYGGPKCAVLRHCTHPSGIISPSNAVYHYAGLSVRKLVLLMPP